MALRIFNQRNTQSISRAHSTVGYGVFFLQGCFSLIHSSPTVFVLALASREKGIPQLQKHDLIKTSKLAEKYAGMYFGLTKAFASTEVVKCSIRPSLLPSQSIKLFGVVCTSPQVRKQGACTLREGQIVCFKKRGKAFSVVMGLSFDGVGRKNCGRSLKAIAQRFNADEIKDFVI